MIKSKLEALTGKKVDLVCEVDSLLLGGIIIKFDKYEIDGSLKSKLNEIKKSIMQIVRGVMSFDIGQLSKDIKARLELSEYGSKIEKTGTVVKVSDGIAQIYGLENCLIYELIEFQGKGFGMAMNLEKNSVLAILFFGDSSLKEGDKALRTNKIVSVPVGYNMLGRVVNGLGAFLDGVGEIEADEFYQIERSARGIIERKSVSVPLETGIKSIDSMIPIA